MKIKKSQAHAAQKKSSNVVSKENINCCWIRSKSSVILFSSHSSDLSHSEVVVIFRLTCLNKKKSKLGMLRLNSFFLLLMLSYVWLATTSDWTQVKVVFTLIPQSMSFSGNPLWTMMTIMAWSLCEGARKGTRTRAIVENIFFPI